MAASKYRMWYNLGRCIADTLQCHGKGYVLFTVDGLVIQSISTHIDGKGFSMCQECKEWVAQTDIRHLIDTNELRSHAQVPQ